MDVHPTEHRSGFLKVMLRALAHRNYRLFFVGQSVSLLGTWMQQAALNWLVYDLTHSPFLLGVVAFSATLPLFLLGPFGGVWADRWDRRRTLLYTQGLLMLQAVLLAALALAELITIWEILVLSAVAGFINALDGAFRSALLPDMVEKREDLANAIALSSLVQSGARTLGPSLAGVLIAALSEEGSVSQASGVCFLLNGLSFLAVCSALLAMDVFPPRPSGPPKSVLEDLKEGIHYACGETAVRRLLGLQMLIGLFGGISSLMPVVAGELLHGGPNTLGLLMASMGVGALGSALYLAARRSQQKAVPQIAAAAIVFSLALMGFGLGHGLELALACGVVLGFTLMFISVGTYTLLQTIVTDDKRGRVISLYLVATLGLMPLGNLLMGALAQRLGVADTFLISGGCCLAGALWFACRQPQLRPLMERLGPEKPVSATVAVTGTPLH